ncbi:hypothetical protein D7231_35315, partial [Streptomyces klenkii]
MPAINPADVPVAPIHTVILTADGPLVDGEPVTVLPDADPYEAALLELRRRAALRSRPVRVIAKEPGGERYFIVGPEGE